MKSHSKETVMVENRGVINIFNQKEIDMNDWVYKTTIQRKRWY